MADKILRTVVSQGTYEFNKEFHTEKHKGASNTVPNEDLSIKQILDQYTRGIPPDNMHSMVGYDPDELDFENDYDETSHPDFDVIDAHNATMEVENRLQESVEGEPAEGDITPDLKGADGEAGDGGAGEAVKPSNPV